MRGMPVPKVWCKRAHHAWFMEPFLKAVLSCPGQDVAAAFALAATYISTVQGDVVLPWNRLRLLLDELAFCA